MATTRVKATKPEPIPELARNPFAFEVLDLASKQRTKAKKVEVLKKYEDPSLKAIFMAIGSGPASRGSIRAVGSR